MFGVDDWIAVGAIALPLLGKMLDDMRTSAMIRHNAALDRIVGMAAREAAGIGRVLATVTPGANPASVERSMINASVATINDEMAASAALVGADDNRLRGIVLGEVNKLLAPVVSAPVVSAVPPASVMDTGLPGGAFALPTIPTPVS